MLQNPADFMPIGFDSIVHAYQFSIGAKLAVQLGQRIAGDFSELIQNDTCFQVLACENCAVFMYGANILGSSKLIANSISCAVKEAVD